MKNQVIVPVLLSGRTTYTSKIVNLVGRSSIVGYWPLSEASGPTVTDVVNGLTGTISGAVPGQPGIGDGGSSALFDGVNDSIDIYSAALAAAVNKDEGSLSIWAKVLDVGTWTDTTNRYSIILQSDSSNRIRLYKTTVSNQITLSSVFGATVKANLTTSSSLGFIHFCLAWSKSGDAVKTYLSGAQVGATLTGLGTWAGVLGATACAIGASNNTGSLGWKGYLGHALICNRALTAAELAVIGALP